MDRLLLKNFQTHFKRYERNIYRLVEGQHFISTRKLVDNNEEQRLLEEILEHSKPFAPKQNAKGELHYLLFTPFRYPPLKGGGRFHTRDHQSIFYGAENIRTCMAEVAYGRFSFIKDTEARLTGMEVPYTHFMISVRSEKSILLTDPPFKNERERISHPTSYDMSQPLGLSMRLEGVKLFTYYSARDPEGINIGLFSVEAFSKNAPLQGKTEHWIVYITDSTIEFQHFHGEENTNEPYVFSSSDFQY
jgi:hypothetical protein